MKISKPFYIKLQAKCCVFRIAKTFKKKKPILWSTLISEKICMFFKLGSIWELLLCADWITENLPKILFTQPVILMPARGKECLDMLIQFMNSW